MLYGSVIVHFDQMLATFSFLSELEAHKVQSRIESLRKCPRPLKLIVHLVNRTVRLVSLCITTNEVSTYVLENLVP